MRIDTIMVRNFKKFDAGTCALHPQFTLLVGENGSGKTSILDALAVALGIWLVEPPDSTLVASGRNIMPAEIRLEPTRTGDRILFRERRPVIVSATGQIGDRSGVTWLRQIRERGRRTTNADAKDARAAIKDLFRRDTAGENVLCPVIAYYGAGRAWLPSNQRTPGAKPNGPARRWAAFYDCLNERIRLSDLQKWFRSELIAAAHAGQMRPGFHIVRRAIIASVPDADDIWFDPDREQIVLSIKGQSQPFDNLSAGQRMMLALVADIAIKAVTQNTFLVPESGHDATDGELLRVLRLTPGVILIDELDVHLHPRWQRRVASDLKRTFPALQFVCTSHSPQVIGEIEPDEIRLLDSFEVPNQSFGMDSNWILQALMGADEQDANVKT
ncbi:MAG TPA: AAA family ATPase, partial [Armatimonadota bacterium]|nr:AAA family ATPase [Armatimonadota bacterium]